MLTYSFNLILLLHHAAGDADDHAISLLILVLESSQSAVKLLVGILSDSTGSEKNDVRIPVILCDSVAAFLEDTQKLFAILG